MVFFFSFLLGGIKRGLVWILGHSYVFWGAKRADMRPKGRQLGIPREDACVRWVGRPGMQWARVLPEIQHFARLDRPPDVLVLHVGGNDLGGRPSRELMKDVKIDFLRLRTSFPEMVIVWSDIVARTNWRLARSVDRLNKTRIKVNKRVGQFVIRNGGLVVRHRELEKDVGLYLRRDGVHLSEVGIDLWSMGLEEGIRRALRVWRSSQG